MVRWSLAAVLHRLLRCMDKGGIDLPSTASRAGSQELMRSRPEPGPVNCPTGGHALQVTLSIITPRFQLLGPCRTE